MYYVYLLDVNDRLVNRIATLSPSFAEEFARGSIDDCYRTVVTDKWGFERLEVYRDKVVYPAGTTQFKVRED